MAEQTLPRLDRAPPQQRNEEEHAPPTERREPKAAYLVLASTFLCLTGSALIWVRRKKLVLPKPGVLELVLIGLGTARLTRLITRDKVMRPLRAQFTVSERHGPEIKEHARGSGMIRAAGELITCPRCTAIWAASGLSLLYLGAPSVGRFGGLLLSSSLISDFVNRSFAIMNDAAADKPSPARAP